MPLILSYLRMKVRCLVIWYLNDFRICMRLYWYVCNFEDNIFFKGGGGECKTKEKCNFSEKWKNSNLLL